MVVVRCTRIDLPKKHRQPVTKAIRELYERLVEGEESKKKNKAGRLSDFAKALKSSLDNAYKPHWHVMAGNSMAFACKKRDGTVGIWHILPSESETKNGKSKEPSKPEGRVMVVIWKSPGLEPLDAESSSEESQKADEQAAGNASDVRLLQPPEAEVEKGSEVETARDVLKRIVKASPTAEDSDLGTRIRRQLTKELGTIWHVIVGREFVIETTEESRNFIKASFGKDKNIVCFQHEQIEGVRINWEKIVTSLPWLLVVVVCFGYMTFHAVCDAAEPDRGRSPMARYLESTVCSKKDWESEFGVVAVIAVSTAFVAKRFFKET